MDKIRQSELAWAFLNIIFPGNTYAKLEENELNNILKVFQGFKKQLNKGQPLKYSPKMSNETKKYIKRYSKSVALELMDLRKKIQENEILPAETEIEKLDFDMYALRAEEFVNFFEYAEDEQTKAFIKLVKDTQQMIFGDRI